MNAENQFFPFTYNTRIHVLVETFKINYAAFVENVQHIQIQVKSFATAKRWKRYITVRHGWCAAPRYTLEKIDRIT